MAVVNIGRCIPGNNMLQLTYSTYQNSIKSVGDVLGGISLSKIKHGWFVFLYYEGLFGTLRNVCFFFAFVIM